MSDRKIQQDILDELEFEPSVSATHIGVAVENGVVTLSGHVGTYFEKLAAEKAVRRVKGVRAIAEEIQIRHSFEKKTADDEIASRALNILQWDVAVPQDKILVMVSDGWITLSGEVDWEYQRDARGDVGAHAVRRLRRVQQRDPPLSRSAGGRQAQDRGRAQAQRRDRCAGDPRSMSRMAARSRWKVPCATGTNATLRVTPPGPRPAWSSWTIV